MARTKAGGDDSLDPQILGAEGDTCSQCGTTLAVDQRYCLNCGTPRTPPRLDYERALAPRETMSLNSSVSACNTSSFGERRRRSTSRPRTKRCEW